MAWLVMLSWLALPSTALAWPAIDRAGHRMPLLGGRWTIALPEDAIPAAIAGDPTGPTPREELDGLALLNTTDGHFAIHATLLEATRPADLAAAIRTLPAPCADPTYAPLGDRTDVLTIRCTTPSPDGAFRPIVAFAVHTDGWVERFEAMIETSDPDDTRARDEGVVFAEAVLMTLRAEDVPAAVDRGTIELGRACESEGAFDALSLTLPDGWVATRQNLAGGQLLRILRVIPLGEGRAMLAVDLAAAGTPPPRLPEGMGTLRASALLGEPVDWLVAEASGQGMRQLAVELVIDCGGGATYARALRLSTGGPSASVDEGQHILESLTLRSERGHHVALEAVSSEAPPIEDPAVGDVSAVEDDGAQGHFWSIAIGGASLLLLGAALAMRARSTRSK